MNHVERRQVVWLVFAIVALALSGAVRPLPAQDAPLKIPDRVLVNYDGTWYLGSIYAMRDGKYKVMRDDYTSDDRWVTLAELKRAPVGERAKPANAALPANIPHGRYVCGTLLSGTMGTTIGEILIAGKGVYTGLVKEGTGPKATFSYDPASGKIQWEGGRLAGFFGKVVESRYSLDNRGKSLIEVTYRVRDGGNLFVLSCQ